MNNPVQEFQREGLSVLEACRTSGIGRTKLYQAIADGSLKARKYGKRTIILRGDLQNFLAGLPAVECIYPVRLGAPDRSYQLSQYSWPRSLFSFMTSIGSIVGLVAGPGIRHRPWPAIARLEFALTWGPIGDYRKLSF